MCTLIIIIDKILNQDSCTQFCRFFQIGSVILALHDASDVFMEAAKVFKYSEKELGASVFFGFFAISWLILRLIFFPFWVIKATRFVLLVFDFIFEDSAQYLLLCLSDFLIDTSQL